MTDLTSTLEAVLFAAGDPVPVARLSLITGTSEADILSAAEELRNEYESARHGIRLVRLGDKLQLCSAAEHAAVIARITEQRKPSSLSQPALETLAIIAYNQPVTSAVISRIRGVDSAYTVGVLADRGLIEAKGRLEAPGRPLLYGTSDVFLRTMGISSLSELPPLPDLASSDGVEKLQAEIEALQKQDTDQLTIYDDEKSAADRE